MSAFGVAALRSGSARGRGSVDHRLARRHLINEFHRGRLRQDQVCDAHPELIRAARNVGMTATVACPICTERGLRLVTYVFGPRLPAHGRLAANNDELAVFHRRAEEYTAYVVETCCSCRWHYLVRALPIGGQRGRRQVG